VRTIPLAAVCALLLATTAQTQSNPPPSFVEAALCIHAGWHYTHLRQPGPPDYLLYGRGYWRTWDVPDTLAGGSGEGGWHEVDAPYRNGLQFTLGTWQSAGGSYDDWASASPATQIARAYAVVSRDGGSWREWPNTSRACGLR
jgi:hypothetical protein